VVGTEMQVLSIGLVPFSFSREEFLPYAAAMNVVHSSMISLSMLSQLPNLISFFPNQDI